MVDTQIVDLTPIVTPLDAHVFEGQVEPGGATTSFKFTRTQIAAGVQAALDAHAGDGTIHFTEASVDHTAIQNIGTNTHAQIDSHIADATLHFTEASIDHTAIQNVGTNTHTQIDTHLADTSAHLSAPDRANFTALTDGSNADSLHTHAGAGGDVVGPASAVDSNFAAFNTTTGKLIKDSGSTAATFATAAQGATADTAVQPGDNVSDLTNDSGFIADIVEDTTPQRGGDVDANGFNVFEVFTAAAGNTFAAGNAGILDAAGAVVLADNTTQAGVEGRLVVASEAVAGGAPGNFVEDGDLGGLTGLTAAVQYFIGTAGSITATPPAAGNFMRVVGVPRSATVLNVKPSADFYTVA